MLFIYWVHEVLRFKQEKDMKLNLSRGLQLYAMSKFTSQLTVMFFLESLLSLIVTFASTSGMSLKISFFNSWNLYLGKIPLISIIGLSVSSSRSLIAIPVTIYYMSLLLTNHLKVDL